MLDALYVPCVTCILPWKRGCVRCVIRWYGIARQDHFQGMSLRFIAAAAAAASVVNDNGFHKLCYRGGVMGPRCYGCGRCIDVCPPGIIRAEKYMRSPAVVRSLLQKVDAVEIHTKASRRVLSDAPPVFCRFRRKPQLGSRVCKRYVRHSDLHISWDTLQTTGAFVCCDYCLLLDIASSAPSSRQFAVFCLCGHKLVQSAENHDIRALPSTRHMRCIHESAGGQIGRMPVRDRLPALAKWQQWCFL